MTQIRRLACHRRGDQEIRERVQTCHFLLTRVCVALTPVSHTHRYHICTWSFAAKHAHAHTQHVTVSHRHILASWSQFTAWFQVNADHLRAPVIPANKRSYRHVGNTTSCFRPVLCLTQQRSNTRLQVWFKSPVVAGAAAAQLCRRLCV